MKKTKLIAILLVLVVAIVNVVIVNHVQAQKNSLRIDDLTNGLAYGEDDDDGWLWGDKENFCVKYECYTDPKTGKTIKRQVGDPVSVDDCMRWVGLYCDYEECPDGFVRLTEINQ